MKKILFFSDIHKHEAMNYVHLSSQKVIPRAYYPFVALISVVLDLGVLSNVVQVLCVKADFPVFSLSQKYNVSSLLIKASNSGVLAEKLKVIASPQLYRGNQKVQSLVTSNDGEKKLIRKLGKKGHHLWQKRDQAGSGKKAMNLVRNICGLPNEKEAVYGVLDEWIAWESEFPLIAAAKALRILRSGNQWKRLIQVAKWMLRKGQGATMSTYDLLLLAFDMDRRLDEAKMLWDMILRTHDRSILKRLFSRMISLYDHHNLPNNFIEVFADMEELGVKWDEDTVRRIARAFEQLGEEDKQKQFLTTY
ncbi:Pentatricopeptide repeat superfamily protein [Perilla frutescens var. hirtella]|nr:Pentatricopeptide repeat superfamily protein [Perilla frutescens var. hirtella]